MTGISFSPDGKRIVFLREGPGQAENSLIIANADGADEQTLITRKGGERFAVFTPAWSPNGKVIACGVRVDGTNETVATVSVDDRTTKLITSEKWRTVSRVVWLSDGSGLVFSAREQNNSQLWYVSYPGGEVRRTTNDANNYGTGSVSITADSGTIATIQVEFTSNIFVASAGDAARAKQITPRIGGRVNAAGISWTPDGKLVYSTSTTGTAHIWIVNSEGAGGRQLTNDPGPDTTPRVSPDGRYIVFVSRRSGGINIWRMDLDGSHLKQLTTGGSDSPPSFSPDGKWVIYDSIATSDLRKVSIDGGDSVRLTDRRVAWPTVSPKDGMIVGLYMSDENSSPRLALLAPEGGAPIKTFDLPNGSFGGAHWTPDGRAILYLINRAQTSTLWSQPVDGGAPKQLADFSPEQIFSFDLSRDGKWLAFARGTIVRDVILITDTSKQ